jgi:glycosyltransferase involved in cell wall biosynthesis
MSLKNRPLISVIMPTYNAEKYLERAINSILEQTYEYFELLILDDASEDNSINIIKSYTDPRIKLFKHEKNQGYLQSVNFLFTQSTGNLIAFQDADDWSDRTRFEKQVKAFEDDTDLRFCGTQCIHYKNNQRKTYSNFPLTLHKVVEKLERGDTVVLCGASVMLKRELLERYGGYREFYDRIGAEHLDWFYQMLHQEKFINLPLHLYTYRAVHNSFTKSLDLNPLKYHCTQVALLTYWQRKLFGSDTLNDENGRAEIIKKIEEPYENDETLIYKRAAITQLAFGQLSGYFYCVKKSILISGLTVGNMKLACIWLPILIFKKMLPLKLQRKVVERNNSKFLKKMGIDLYK